MITKINFSDLASKGMWDPYFTYMHPVTDFMQAYRPDGLKWDYANSDDATAYQTHRGIMIETGIDGNPHQMRVVVETALDGWKGRSRKMDPSDGYLIVRDEFLIDTQAKTFSTKIQVEGADLSPGSLLDRARSPFDAVSEERPLDPFIQKVVFPLAGIPEAQGYSSIQPDQAMTAGAQGVVQPPNGSNNFPYGVLYGSLAVNFLMLMAAILVIPRMTARARIQHDILGRASPDEVQKLIKMWEKEKPEKIIAKFLSDIREETATKSRNYYGRTEQIALARANLRLDGAPPLALIGPRGVGKTSLLRQLAKEAEGKPRFLRVNLNELLADSQGKELFRLAPILRIARDDPQNIRIVIEIPYNEKPFKGFHAAFSILQQEADEGRVGLVYMATPEGWKALKKKHGEFRGVVEQEVTALDPESVKKLTQEAIDAQFARLKKEKPKPPRELGEVSSEVLSSILQKTSEIPPFSRETDPQRSMDFGRRLTLFAWDQSKNGRIIIDKELVERFCRTHSQPS
jgi:energy-coupling factor transporter ATP-binding protein EcfA2